MISISTICLKAILHQGLLHEEAYMEYPLKQGMINLTNEKSPLNKFPLINILSFSNEQIIILYKGKKTYLNKEKEATFSEAYIINNEDGSISYGTKNINISCK